MDEKIDIDGGSVRGGHFVLFLTAGTGCAGLVEGRLRRRNLLFWKKEAKNF
jgi:hypothetical protein